MLSRPHSGHGRRAPSVAVARVGYPAKLGLGILVHLLELGGVLVEVVAKARFACWARAGCVRLTDASQGPGRHGPAPN